MVRYFYSAKHETLIAKYMEKLTVDDIRAVYHELHTLALKFNHKIHLVEDYSYVNEISSLITVEYADLNQKFGSFLGRNYLLGFHTLIEAYYQIFKAYIKEEVTSEVLEISLDEYCQKNNIQYPTSF